MSYHDLPAFLRRPTRADVKPANAPASLPEPSFYRRELGRSTAVAARAIGWIAGLLWCAIGFLLGVFLYS